jgi:hypothetical protein
VLVVTVEHDPQHRPLAGDGRVLTRDAGSAVAFENEWFVEFGSGAPLT